MSSFWDNLTKEYPSTWNLESVKKWKKKALKSMKSYYLNFRGSQFDEYVMDEDENLLLAKICFAMFGPPTGGGVTEKKTPSEEEQLCNGYEEEQKTIAQEILQLILGVHNEKNNRSNRVLVGIIFIACKEGDSEYCLPIFSIFTGSNPLNPRAARSYVDTQKRTYGSWDDWKTNNTLPMLKYCFPKHGFFTSSVNCRYEFDETKDPSVCFENSPVCNILFRIFATTDIFAAITALACAAVAVASMLTPIGPAVMLTSAVAGGSSAVYGTGRAIVRLTDKGNHGGSLTDLESLTLWFSIFATPLHLTSLLVNSTLIKGATANGRIFSSSVRMCATVLNFGTLGVDGVMLGFGIANMVDKYKQNQLSSLDILQFSMSAFFFTNTLIRPQMASSIIKNAQESHIQNYAKQISDADAKATFNRFLDQNKGKGTIVENSKIIRKINRINDPNKLFGGLSGTSDLKIGKGSGESLLVNDQDNINGTNSNEISFKNPAKTHNNMDKNPTSASNKVVDISLNTDFSWEWEKHTNIKKPVQTRKNTNKTPTSASNGVVRKGARKHKSFKPRIRLPTFGPRIEL